MNMQPLDWIIVVVTLGAMGVIAWGANSLTRSVSDFLAANRAAGRYLLTMASGMSGLGAISIAASFEKYYASGFGGLWWGQILAPLMLVLALSGFVVYRFRETRALTVAQFYEMRYSRRFRIFAGLVMWISGILNYGIFPAVTARFLIYFTGMPANFEVAEVTISTFPVVMACMLSMALVITLSGGQVAVMITDFIQGQFVNVTMLVILVVLVTKLNWWDVMAGLQQAPKEQSMINPFKQGDIPDFNVWFFLMAAVVGVYGYRSWQGSQAYNAAPKNPHEARMATILGEFRGMITYLLIMLMPIFVYAMLHLPEYAEQQHIVSEKLATIGDEQVQTQMRVPVALSTLLPTGVMGMFAAVIIAAAVSTDDTYLHSWGAIFIQDVVMPFRGKPLSPKAHIWLLRASMLGVAVFAFVFSLTFPLNEYIYMYFSITGAIYIGGAGAVLLGGLYWKRGAVEGAWAAMITGSTLAVLGIVLRNIIWPQFLPGWKTAYPHMTWLAALPEEFPLNGMQMSFLTAVTAIAVYVAVSLLSRRPPVNMDKLLHRGAYRVEAQGHHPRQEATAIGPVPTVETSPGGTQRTIWRLLGVGPDFTTGDKVIYLMKISWVGLLFTVFAIGTILGMTIGLPDTVWVSWWTIQTGLTAILACITVVWFLIGGFRDLADLVRTLRTAERDEFDDGSVRSDDHVQP